MGECDQEVECHYQKNCADCTALARCGWCTGMNGEEGKCMEASDDEKEVDDLIYAGSRTPVDAKCPVETHLWR